MVHSYPFHAKVFLAKNNIKKLYQENYSTKKSEKYSLQQQQKNVKFKAQKHAVLMVSTMV